MKILKLGVVICGALGLVGLVLIGIGALMETQKTSTLVMLVAFGLPVVMGLVAMSRPPLQPWQAGVSLACFALAGWKLRLWETLGSFGDVPTGTKLVLVGATLGVIASAIAIVKPESP